MNNILLLFLAGSILFSNKINYWNLGISINNNSKRVIRKDINIDNIIIEESNVFQTNKGNTIYTLDKNYIIEPEKHQNILKENTIEYGVEYFYNIKSLIANNEYFEAAKKLISIDEESIRLVFDGQDDYYYYSSIIYYNLGNMNEAYLNIENISNRHNDSKTLFLEALILQSIDAVASVSLLLDIIEYFPNEDYAEYAKNILKDSQWILKNIITA